MNTKERIIDFLESNRGNPVSGSELAECLGITRSAVWKAVNELKEIGYKIHSVQSRGYILDDENSMLSAASIKKYIKTDSFNFIVEDKVSSTNTVIKEMAEKGEGEFTVLIANSQTAGRGRFGRTFFSPPESGIYMSILLRPRFSAQSSLYLTTCAAVCAARAIENASEIPAKIKWVNDIYLAERKVCGILTEASVDFESGSLNYAVIGIGINIFPPEGDFPPDIQKKAGSIFSSAFSGDVRSKIVADILNNFIEFYPQLEHKPFLEEYKRRSLLTGREILVLKADKSIPARADFIDDDFKIHVTYKDGSTDALSSGDVSLMFN